VKITADMLRGRAAGKSLREVARGKNVSHVTVLKAFRKWDEEQARTAADAEAAREETEAKTAAARRREIQRTMEKVAREHEERVDATRSEVVTILDIGAGYGRLAHHATTAFANVTYVCTDAIPLSTFVSRDYLHFRGVDRATVIPLDRIADEIAGTKVDLAVNIHSFSECPASAITWWLDLLAENEVQHVMIVPNTDTRLLSKEREGPKVDLRPLLTGRGYELVRLRPKYGSSDFMWRHGLHGRFPMFYFLFERRR
jgi:SAM-dependent methyltransferase